MGLQPALQQELEGLLGALVPAQAGGFGCQVAGGRRQFGTHGACPGRAHPAGGLGDGQSRLAAAAEGFEPGPEQFPAPDGAELAVVAEPSLDLGEGELRADVGAADTVGEGVVTAPPVAHRGPPDAGDPGDFGQGDGYDVRAAHRSVSEVRGRLIGSAPRVP
jgi:hypothetical protein